MLAFPRLSLWIFRDFHEDRSPNIMPASRKLMASLERSKQGSWSPLLAFDLTDRPDNHDLDILIYMPVRIDGFLILYL
jgi:hypothetical protein